jgi:hypothetical protein
MSSRRVKRRSFGLQDSFTLDASSSGYFVFPHTEGKATTTDVSVYLLANGRNEWIIEWDEIAGWPRLVEWVRAALTWIARRLRS